MHSSTVWFSRCFRFDLFKLEPINWCLFVMITLEMKNRCCDDWLVRCIKLGCGIDSITGYFNFDLSELKSIHQSIKVDLLFSLLYKNVMLLWLINAAAFEGPDIRPSYNLSFQTSCNYGIIFHVSNHFLLSPLHLIHSPHPVPPPFLPLYSPHAVPCCSLVGEVNQYWTTVSQSFVFASCTYRSEPLSRLLRLRLRLRLVLFRRM